MLRSSQNRSPSLSVTSLHLCKTREKGIPHRSIKKGIHHRGLRPRKTKTRGLYRDGVSFGSSQRPKIWPFLEIGARIPTTKAVTLLVRDAEMTIKIIFERSSQKGVDRGFEKRVNRGPILKFYCRPKAQEKQHFGKSHFYCRHFFPGNTVTIILDNYPPSTLQGVGLGCCKNPRIIVGENYCHSGAS